MSRNTRTKSGSDSILATVAKSVAVTLVGGLVTLVARELAHQATKKQTSSINVNRDSSPAAYMAIVKWLESTGLVRANKHASVLGVDNTGCDSSDTARMSPAPGIYYCTHLGMRLRVEFQEEVDTSSHRNSTSHRVRIVALNDPHGRLIPAISAIIREQLATDQLRVEDYENYEHVMKARRDISCVVMDPKEKKRLTDHLDWWSTSSGEYARLGIPYKTGVLLYGPPGTGKTSLAQAIASYLGYVLVVAPMSALVSRGSGSTIQRGSVVLIEDFDRNSLSHSDSDSDSESDSGDSITKMAKAFSGESVSKILNFLDGVSSPEGVVFILSTNHIDRIDPALIRSGRIDVRILMDHFDETRAVEMGNLFGIDPETVLALGEETWREPASLQLALMHLRKERLIQG